MPVEQTSTHNQTPSALIPFLVIMLGFGFVLACVELFTHRKRGQSFACDMAAEAEASRAPLLCRKRMKNNTRKPKVQKKKARWYQLWRKTGSTEADPEQGLTEPPTQQPPSDDHYGTFSGFSGVHAAADIDISLGTPPDRSFLKKTTTKSTRGSLQTKYEIVRTLKQVSEGQIRLVRHRKTRKLFVAKQLPCPFVDDLPSDHWPGEAEVMAKQLGSHQNIVRLLEVIVDDNHAEPFANLIIEYCDAGDISNVISACIVQEKQVPAQFILHFISSMLDALAFIHYGEIYDPKTEQVHHPTGGRRMLHRDVKCQNTFLKWDQSKYGLPTVVVGDFGFATTEKNNYGVLGTPKYMAPEIEDAYQDKDMCSHRVTGPSSMAGDMYAFGVSLFELIALRNYEPPSNISAEEYIRASFLLSKISDHENVLQLLTACLAKERTERPASNGFHDLSAKYKRELEAWYEAGGRVPTDFWPQPWEFDEGEKSSVSHRLRRVPAHSNLSILALYSESIHTRTRRPHENFDHLKGTPYDPALVSQSIYSRSIGSSAPSPPNERPKFTGIADRGTKYNFYNLQNSPITVASGSAAIEQSAPVASELPALQATEPRSTFSWGSTVGGADQSP